MGVHAPFAVVSNTAAVSIGQNVDTILITSPFISPPLDGAAMLIIVTALLSLAAGVTAMTYGLRRGALITSPTITGQLGSANASETASLTVLRTVMGVDLPGIVGPIQYSLSCLTTGATGVGGTVFASIAVMSL